jgi:hypothetical protein
MDRAEYLNAVNKYMYQGEVLGEALLACYVALELDPDRRYRWGTILQLETETKARLRPFLTKLGLSIAQDDTREVVAEFAQKFGSKSWRDHMNELAGITDMYLEKFRNIADAAPVEEQEITHSMVRHEAAINRFAHLELEGDSANSLNDVIAQLQYPLTKPA